MPLYIENTYIGQEDQNGNFPIGIYWETTDENVYAKIPKAIQLFKISCERLNSILLCCSFDSWLDKEK